MIISPFISVIAYAMLSKPQYEASFNSALSDKIDRIKSIEGRKIVVVGGSSVAFGLDSEKLEQYTGIPVVNFGLYAAIGTKLMMDLADDYIGKGDIVVLAPELDTQALSLYFSAENTLMAADGDFSVLKGMGSDNILSLLGGMWDLARGKLRISKKGGLSTDSLGIYQSQYFNEYGDFTYERTENVMDGYYLPNNMIDLNKETYSADFDEFCDYVNDYVKRVKKKGATVCFSYCPMNSLALVEGSMDRAQEFAEFLDSKLDCDFISYINDYILDPGYFFDTNYHLNDAGVTVRTIRLAKDIRLQYSILDNPITDKEPAAPDLPFADVVFEGEDENAKYFVYSDNPNGSKCIIGLSELGKTMTELTLPLGVDGRIVSSVSASAFANSSVEKIVISADSNVTQLMNGAFAGASELSSLWIYKKSGDEINPPVDFRGVASDFIVHVPIGSDFSIHYFWSERNIEFAEDINLD